MSAYSKTQVLMLNSCKLHVDLPMPMFLGLKDILICREYKDSNELNRSVCGFLPKDTKPANPLMVNNFSETTAS